MWCASGGGKIVTTAPVAAELTHLPRATSFTHLLATRRADDGTNEWVHFQHAGCERWLG
ncbi:MAG: hypothetical protein KatS3mg114_0232 [Planctomycetaceae bacterium]|nr:MAG: hypothetical protein KatS3mg114_0232 [Planctomycetaceae bacterium]